MIVFRKTDAKTPTDAKQLFASMGKSIFSFVDGYSSKKGYGHVRWLNQCNSQKVF